MNKNFLDLLSAIFAMSGVIILIVASSLMLNYLFFTSLICVFIALVSKFLANKI